MFYYIEVHLLAHYIQIATDLPILSQGMAICMTIPEFQRVRFKIL
jgi:hypothetical protein